MKLHPDDLVVASFETSDSPYDWPPPTSFEPTPMTNCQVCPKPIAPSGEEIE